MKERIRIALKEESTWRGIIGLLTAFGLVIEPELATSIIAVGLALMGGINVVARHTPEKKEEQTEQTHEN